MSELQAEVAFDLPLNRTYTYRWSGDLVPGVRVKAPFGKRQMEGVVVSVSPLEENPPVTLKFLDKVVDKEGILGPYSLDLAKWIGEFTLCTWGSALAAMVPSARREKSLDLEEEIESKPYDNFAKNVLGEALVYLRLAEDSIASIQKHVKSIEK